MRTLCIDARMAFSSGIGVAIRQLSIYFAESFRVILLVDKLDQAWCKGLEQIHVKAPIYSIQEQFELPRKIPRCDLFWSPHYNIPLFPIQAKKRIVTIHDVCHLVFAKYLSLPEKIYAKVMLHAAYRRADCVIANSHFTKAELEKYLGKRKAGVEPILMGMDPTSFQKVGDPGELEKIRKKYQLPKKYLLFVGNLKPHKNLRSLIDAFSQTQLTEWKLVVVGKMEGLRNHIGSIDHEKVIGLHNVPNEDLPSLYTLAGLLVFPSLYEGFGLPPLEAMRCGCPTAVSNVASIPEVCGEASLYFPPENIQEMARVIEKGALDEELRKELIEKGSDRVQLFHWKKTAKNYMKVFEKL